MDIIWFGEGKKINFKMIKDVEVSFITVNYNGLDDTMELLTSIANLQKNDISFETIVVDNASKEDPEPKILSNFPFVNLLKSSTNLGFAGGNNLGIKHAKGKYLFFINNDTIVSDDLVEILLQRFKENDQLGMLSPKIKFHETNIIQYAGFSPLNVLSRNFAYGNKREDGSEYEEFLNTYAGHGAAMMVPMKVIEKVGAMPEFYFLYYEELDWAQQIARAGFEIKVEQKAKIYHKESMSVGKNSPFKTYYMNRNRILFVKRNFNGIKRFIGLFYLFFIVSPSKLLKYFIYREKDHFKAYLNAVKWHLNTPKYE
ncbi:glycosyltransferase family 2 protein [Marivirga harenae]|uniref:glycosyltransferase family 2 protein n=1 Tax=Marivirga harenae TaxID=2010992 RepID=UPI0026DFB8F7|nr:glycosyltransferase family 2 protein [Marivirga harenae]WKV12906.1 glycosyltransferase family 2 protein [Marivirga harenae]